VTSWIENPLVVDSAQVVGAVGSVVAIAVSGWALFATKRQERDAIDRLVHDRRIQFDVEVLLQLARVVGTVEFAVTDGPVRVQTATLIALLGFDQVPKTCAVMGFDAPQAAVDAYRKTKGDAGKITQLVLGEIRSLIEQRMTERS
jgi:hypothetical protein